MTQESDATQFMKRVARGEGALLPQAMPQKIGRHIVVAKVGAGGMGIVYSAFDPELNRKVAVKLIRPDRESETARIRLVREAQAMARLKHVNVVTIHDTGLFEDSVYVVMDFIEGPTLLNWLGDGSRPWRDIVGVFVQAGQGLAAAHAARFVHRDFKPENVMVDVSGTVKVTDFGLVRAFGDTPEGTAEVGAEPLIATHALGSHLSTQGSALGTPNFMAPEQHLGGVATPASDQYSFCIALYEALYAQHPFPGGDTVAQIARKCNGVIASPARPRRAAIPARLHAAVVRGLAVDPAQRWPGMQELLSELLSVLRYDPRRRRRQIAMSAGLTLALAAVFGVREYDRRATFATCTAESNEILRDWNDAARTRVHDAFLATGKEFAEPTFAKTTPWLDRWVNTWRHAAGDVCTAYRVDETLDAELYERARDCLDERRGDFVALVHELGATDAFVLPHATSVAAALTSVEACTQPMRLRERSTVDPSSRREMLAIRAQLAQALSLEASGIYDQGLVVATAALTAARAANAVAQVAQAELRVGSIQDRLGKHVEAETSLRRALSWAREARAQQTAVESMIKLVHVVGVGAGSFEAGKFWAEAAQTLLSLLSGEHPDEQARLDEALAAVHFEAGEYAEAAGLHARALATREATLGSSHPDTARSLHNLAFVLGRSGQYDEAVRLFKQALAVREQAFGHEHPDVAETLDRFAVVHRLRGEYPEAIRLYTRALAIRERSLGELHPQTAATINNLAVAHSASEDYDKSLPLFTRALKIIEQTGGADSIQAAKTLDGLANIRRVFQEYDEAIVLFTRAIRIVETKLGKDHPSLVGSIEGLANVYREKRMFAESGRLYERMLTISERKYGEDHPYVAFALHGLGALQLAQNRPEAAIPPLERARTIRESKGVSSDELAETSFALARALWDANIDHPRAIALAEQSLQLYAVVADPTDQQGDVLRWISTHSQVATLP